MTSKLFDVIREEGVLCVFVATKDGFVVDAEADTGVDPEEPAAIASTILLRTKGVMDRLIPEH
ncbi:MAG: roadblock/LC7 domain-containing protein, partial [Methanopyri archaeon]|nr:roadblock/LC7 domain-containing protein [Methanopyri archaeon]